MSEQVRKFFSQTGTLCQCRPNNRAKKETKKLKTTLVCVIRNIFRKCPKPEGRLAKVLNVAQAIFNKKRNDTNKVYSIHAPEAERIDKGKVHKNMSLIAKYLWSAVPGDNWILAINALHGNPFDEHMLKDTTSSGQTKYQLAAIACLL